MSRLLKVKLVVGSKTFLWATDYVDDATGQWERRLLSVGPIRRTASVDRTFAQSPVEIKIDDADGTIQYYCQTSSPTKFLGSAVTLYAFKADNSALAATWSFTVRNWRRDNGRMVFDCVQDLGGKLDKIISGWDLVINTSDFPDAARRAVGRPVPFPAGVCSSPHGKIPCWKVVEAGSGTNRKYLITWSDPGGDARVTSIDKVFNNGRKVKSSFYSLSRDANGWEYCEYNGKMPRIRVNVTAKSDPSTAGANPVIALNAVLAGESITLVDDGHLDGSSDPIDFEDYCDDNGWVMAGQMEGQIRLRDYLENWARSFNCFWHFDAAGQVHIKHFDFSLGLKGAYLGQFYNFSMTASMFDSFIETMDMSAFANRLRARFNFDDGEWDEEILHDSTTSDYPVSTFGAVERVEDYYLADMDPDHVDYEARIKWFGCGNQRAKALVPLETYETLGGDVLKRALITHHNQIEGPQYYLILEDAIDYMREVVDLDLFVVRVTPE